MYSGFYSKRIISGLIAGLFGLLIVGAGGFLFTFYAYCKLQGFDLFYS